MKRTQKLRLLAGNYTLTKFMLQPINGRKAVKLKAVAKSMTGVISSHTMLRIDVIKGNCLIGEFVGGVNKRFIWHDDCRAGDTISISKNSVIILFDEEAILHIDGNDCDIVVDFLNQAHVVQKPSDLIMLD